MFLLVLSLEFTVFGVGVTVCRLVLTYDTMQYEKLFKRELETHGTKN